MSTALTIHGGKPIRTRPFPTWPIFDEREEHALVATLRTGKWGKLDGGEVAKFERRFADYHHAKHGIAVVNGTVSLRISLLAAGLAAVGVRVRAPRTIFTT